MLKKSIILIIILLITYMGIDNNINLSKNDIGINYDVKNLLEPKKDIMYMQHEKEKAYEDNTCLAEIQIHEEEPVLIKEIVSINGKGYIKFVNNEKQNIAKNTETKIEEQIVEVVKEEKKEIELNKEITTFVENDITKINEVAIGNKKYSANDIRKQISFRDQLYGIRLAFKVNVPYLISVMKNGINDDTKEKVKIHLKQKLTPEEYKRVEDLVDRYIYLIE